MVSRSTLKSRTSSLVADTAHNFSTARSSTCTLPQICKKVHNTTPFIAHFPSAHEDQRACYTTPVLPSYWRRAGTMVSKLDWCPSLRNFSRSFLPANDCRRTRDERRRTMHLDTASRFENDAIVACDHAESTACSGSRVNGYWRVRYGDRHIQTGRKDRIQFVFNAAGQSRTRSIWLSDLCATFSGLLHCLGLPP